MINNILCCKLKGGNAIDLVLECSENGVPFKVFLYDVKLSVEALELNSTGPVVIGEPCKNKKIPTQLVANGFWGSDSFQNKVEKISLEDEPPLELTLKDIEKKYGRKVKIVGGGE